MIASIIVVPAQAGVILGRESRAVQDDGCSRTGGGDPKVYITDENVEKLFPHRRG